MDGWILDIHTYEYTYILVKCYFMLIRCRMKYVTNFWVKEEKKR